MVHVLDEPSRVPTLCGRRAVFAHRLLLLSLGDIAELFGWSTDEVQFALRVAESARSAVTLARAAQLLGVPADDEGERALREALVRLVREPDFDWRAIDALPWS